VFAGFASGVNGSTGLRQNKRRARPIGAAPLGGVAVEIEADGFRLLTDVVAVRPLSGNSKI